MTGQITRGTPLGDWIYETVKNPNIIDIVEIGTGSGLGSTKCIYDAIIDSGKNDYLVYTIELNKDHYELAKKNITSIPNFHILNGYITTKMIDYNRFGGEFFKKFNHTQCQSWSERDISDFAKCENVLYQLPKRIDLLILDGGVFTSYDEFCLLKDRSIYIVLDDTADIKNFDAAAEILTNQDRYDIIKNDQKDRNGYLIANNLLG
jgi:hypothetical protein